MTWRLIAQSLIVRLHWWNTCVMSLVWQWVSLGILQHSLSVKVLKATLWCYKCSCFPNVSWEGEPSTSGRFEVQNGHGTRPNSTCLSTLCVLSHSPGQRDRKNSKLLKICENRKVPKQIVSVHSRNADCPVEHTHCLDLFSHVSCNQKHAPPSWTVTWNCRR